MANKHNNAIKRLLIYRTEAGWAFDDGTVGLLEEPFVSGTPEIISDIAKDVMTGLKACVESGEHSLEANEVRLIREMTDIDEFALDFSDQPFPYAEWCLLRERDEMGGCWYVSENTGKRGWLCPALFKYFPTPPETIHVGFVAVTRYAPSIDDPACFPKVSP